MKSQATRFISSLLIGMLLVVALAPLQVYAQAAVTEVGPPTLLHQFITSVKTTATAISTSATAGSTGALATKEYALDPIVFAIGQAAIQSLTKSTVNWINNGFQGSPAYVTDLKGTLQDAADQTAQRFLHEIQADIRLNSPFRDGLAQTVLKKYYVSTGVDGFSIRNPYTLNQVSRNDRAFQRGDFSQGGLRAWLVETINPQNNWFGAQALFEGQLNGRVADTNGQLQQEIAQGNGFLSWRKCDQQGETQVVDNTQTTGDLPLVTVGPDGKVTDTGQKAAGSAVTTVTSLTPKKTCLQSHIETPGSVIANQLNKSLGLGADSLVTAKEFNEIVNALMAQLMKNVLGSTGLGGLSRGSSASGARPYFDQTVSDNTSASTIVATEFSQTVTDQSARLQTYVNNWKKISDAANAAKSALLASSCGSDTVITSEIDPVLTQAAAAIDAGQSGINRLEQIQTRILQATSPTSGGIGDTSDASAAYQDLLKTLPDAAAVSYADAQSQDSGDATPPTLYTRMTQLAGQQCSGPV